MTSILEDFALTAGWQHVWRVRRHQYDAEFLEFMDKIFADGKGVSLWPEIVSENG